MGLWLMTVVKLQQIIQTIVVGPKLSFSHRLCPSDHPTGHNCLSSIFVAELQN